MTHTDSVAHTHFRLTHTASIPHTQMAVDVRKRVNTWDNLYTTKAVDALLNAETVALFNNRCGFDTLACGFRCMGRDCLH